MDSSKRSPSLADLALGPSQRSELSNEPTKQGGDKSKKKRSARPATGPSWYWLYFFTALAVGLGITYVVDKEKFDDFVRLAVDCVNFRRLPATAQDNLAAIMWILLSIPVIMVLDFGLCYPLSRSHIARWYFLHAGTNAIVTILALPDIYYTLADPGNAISVKYCKSLPFPACSDLPTVFIVGLHLYHMLFFKLTSDDLFHHLLFVPIICFAHFAYPFGAAANILCFFISGFPGGIDYLLLGLVKNGVIHPIREKRLNCSINTWLRAPGITIRSALVPTFRGRLSPKSIDRNIHTLPIILCSCVFFWCGWMCLEDDEKADRMPGVMLWVS